MAQLRAAHARNALVQKGDAAATEIHANCAVVKAKRIPPVSREDL